MDDNYRIGVRVVIKNGNNKPYPCLLEVSFKKDLEEDAKDDDYIISIVNWSNKYDKDGYKRTTFKENDNTYKVKGSLKEGILYCCR